MKITIKHSLNFCVLRLVSDMKIQGYQINIVTIALGSQLVSNMKIQGYQTLTNGMDESHSL